MALPFEHIEIFRDGGTDSRLLPEILRQTTNSEEFAYGIVALEESLNQRRKKEDRELLEQFYIYGKTKTEIALEQGVVPSTVVKRMQKIEREIQEEIAYTLRVFRRYQKQKDPSFG